MLCVTSQIDRANQGDHERDYGYTAKKVGMEGEEFQDMDLGEI